MLICKTDNYYTCGALKRGENFPFNVVIIGLEVTIKKLEAFPLFQFCTSYYCDLLMLLTFITLMLCKQIFNMTMMILGITLTHGQLLMIFHGYLSGCVSSTKLLNSPI